MRSRDKEVEKEVRQHENTFINYPTKNTLSKTKNMTK